eukprot:1532357-Rhodomonas_salina.1
MRLTSNAAAVEHATTNVLSPQHKQILTLVLNAAHHASAPRTPTPFPCSFFPFGVVVVGGGGGGGG